MMLELRCREQRVIFPNTNSGYGVGRGRQLLHRGDAAAPVSHLRPTQGRGGGARPRPAANTLSFRLATVFGMWPRMRAGPPRQRLHVPRGDRPLRGAVRGRLQAQLPPRARRGAGVPARARHFDAMKGRSTTSGCRTPTCPSASCARRSRSRCRASCSSEAPVGKDPDQRNYIVSNAQDRGHRLQAGVSLDARHRRADQGLHDAEEHRVRQRLTRRLPTSR